MNWKGHIALGLPIQLLFFIILIYNFKFNFVIVNLIALFLVIFVSPLVMDLDSKHGKLREILTYIGLILGVLGIIVYYINSNVLLMIIGIILSSTAHLTVYVTKHRGFMHSIVFCIIYSILIYAITTDIHISFISLIGCYTHLLGDKLFFKII